MFAIVIDPSKKIQAAPNLCRGLFAREFALPGFLCSFPELKVDTLKV